MDFSKLTKTQRKVYEARFTAFQYLMKPERVKHRGRMAKSLESEARCCLGHMCVALNVEFVHYDAYSHTLSKIIGMHKFTGGSLSEKPLIKGKGYTNLTGLNDYSPMTPQEIGQYLMSVIWGGEDTPLKPLDEC